MGHIFCIDNIFTENYHNLPAESHFCSFLFSVFIGPNIQGPNIQGNRIFHVGFYISNDFHEIIEWTLEVKIKSLCSILLVIV